MCLDDYRCLVAINVWYEFSLSIVDIIMRLHSPFGCGHKDRGKHLYFSRSSSMPFCLRHTSTPSSTWLPHWWFLKWVSCLLNLLCRFKWFSFPCFLCFYRVSKQVSDLVMIRSVHRFCFWKFTESSLLIPCLTSSSVHLGAPSVKKRISVYFNRKRVAIEALLKWALVRLVESGTLISNGCNQLG